MGPLKSSSQEDICYLSVELGTCIFVASFMLGLLLGACFLPPANHSGGRLGFRNGVLAVANCTMLHLLVMIKLLLGTFLPGNGFLEHLGGDVKVHN